MTQAPPRRSSVLPRSERKRVLVVDDDDETRGAIAHLLGMDYEIAVAADGVEGLARATEDRPPDLVIADVWMPRLDGVEMVKRMRKLDALRSTPVIFLTGQTSTESVVAGINAGARHYLTKPVDPDLLEAKVRKLLGGVAHA